jgi:hypothetical protein
MYIATMMEQNVQIEATVADHRSPELLGQLRRKSSQLNSGQIRMPDTSRSATQIHRRRDQSFIHRQDAVPKTTNPGFIPESLMESLAQADADIFDGVMGVDVQVPLTVYLQIE